MSRLYYRTIRSLPSSVLMLNAAFLRMCNGEVTDLRVKFTEEIMDPLAPWT